MFNGILSQKRRNLTLCGEFITVNMYFLLVHAFNYTNAIISSLAPRRTIDVWQEIFLQTNQIANKNDLWIKNSF